MGTSSLELYDPRLGEPGLKVELLEPIPGLAEPRRSNCFTLLWVQAGRGTFWADLAHHPFKATSLLFFSPYQTLRLVPESPVRGHVVRFHANFLCVETFHAEVGCNGVLFNDPYGIPLVLLDDRAEAEVGGLVGRMRRELQECGLAHAEVLVSYLKMLLILATRLKLDQQGLRLGARGAGRPVLDELRRLIEAHYRGLHGPADYAERLHVTPKTLGRIVRKHLHKTLTELIRDRILIHAKWQLLHTLKPVKEVAREVGFEDELYFSRLFKKATGYSPTFFREFETAIRGGRNLSMSSGHGPSILHPAGPPGRMT